MKEMISVTFTGGSKTAGERKRCAWAGRSGQWRVGGQVELWGLGRAVLRRDGVTRVNVTSQRRASHRRTALNSNSTHPITGA